MNSFFQWTKENILLVALGLLFVVFVLFRISNTERQTVFSYDKKYHLDYIEKIIEPKTGDVDLFYNPRLVIFLHGLGDNPENFTQLIDDYTKPMRAIFIASPPFQNFDSIQDYERYLGESVANVIEALELKYDSYGQTVLIGFSMGAGTVFYVAANYPDKISKGIAISGRLSASHFPDQRVVSKSLPVIHVLHSRSDDIVRYSEGMSAVQNLQNLGYEITVNDFDGGHTIPAEVRKQVEDLIGE